MDFVELIPTKSELKVKIFMLGYIHVKMS